MPLLWIELGLLTVLVSVLLWSRWRQWKRQLRKEISLPPGHGFDTSPVQSRLNNLRQDHCASLSASRKTPQHELFAATVRQSLRHLSYFRSLAQTEGATQPEHAEEAR